MACGGIRHRNGARGVVWRTSSWKKGVTLSDILSALTGQITAALPTIAAVFGAIIGLVFVFAVGAWIVRRVRGSVR